MKKEKIASFVALILPPVAAFLIAGLSADAFVENMATLGGIVTLVPIIAETIKDKWNLQGVTWIWNIKAMKLITWALSILLVWVSYFTGWGFEGFEATQIVAYGIGAGLVSNEYFTLQTVKLLLQAIFQR